MGSDSLGQAIFGAIVLGLIGIVFAVLKSAAANKVKANAVGKRLVFVIGKTENLDDGFGRGPGVRYVAPDGTDVTHLNKCNIGCTNVGAETIKDLKFDVVVPGNRKYLTAEFRAKDIASSATFSHLDNPPMVGSTGIKITLPFLNTKESFPLSVWFEGLPDKCQVKCRLEDVNCVVKQTNRVLSDYVQDVGKILATAAPAALIAILEAIVSRSDSSGDSDPGS